MGLKRKYQRRNPGDPHRRSSWTGTEKRVEQYYGLVALLNTWEAQPDAIQIADHDYIVKLRARVRQVKNYLAHRADARVKI